MSHRFCALLSLPASVLIALASASMSSPASAHECCEGHAHEHAAANAELGVFIGVDDLLTLQAAHAEAGDLVLLDARKPDAYAAGHLPGAINLAPDDLRTPKAKPTEGYSQYLFRVNDDYEDGQLDAARYAAIFGGAGIQETDTVVVYGNHAGKADGSVPAMILDMLGHQGPVHFLDGVGVDQWTAAGHELSTEPATRPATDYAASPRVDVVWNLDDVQAHLGDASVVFYDTRSLEEFTGKNLRSNRQGGRIPGAVRLNYSDLLDDDKRTLHADAIVQAHEARGLTSDKTLVLYCQTSTRVSLPYLALRKLGYENVVVYDASVHEYLNRDDTQIETGPVAD